MTMTSALTPRPAARRVSPILHVWHVSTRGEPATSAGVERLFSKAGRMHHDLKGSMEDGSLEHSLIATLPLPTQIIGTLLIGHINPVLSWVMGCDGL